MYLTTLACFIVQTRGRTKSLFRTMKQLLRLDDIARGGRGRAEVFDLLGLRVVVSPNEGIPVEDGEAMAAQVSQLPARAASAASFNLFSWEKPLRADTQRKFQD